MDTFGATLDYFCQRQGMTQQELADEVGVTRNTIGNWKKRGRPPTAPITAELAKKLYLDENETNELLASAGYAPKYPSNQLSGTVLPHNNSFTVRHMIVERLEVSDKNERRPVHSSTRCDFYEYISLPPHYVERTDIFKSVLAMLLTTAPSPAPTTQVKIKVDAFHGMGGIGKTVLVRALCDDPMIQMAFPDGILWTTLGQAPDIALKMREWIHVLGGSITENVSTIDYLKEALTKLLKGRTCLLIVDDVWQWKHVEAFHLDVPYCRLFLVTRDAQIASALGAELHTVSGMTEAEAIALLDAWSNGHVTKIDSSIKSQIVKELGYLPLALKLAGGRLQDVPVDKWLADFAELRDLDAEFDADNPEDSLFVSFTIGLQALKVRLRDLYMTLGVFRENEGIPEFVIEKLWVEMDGTQPKDTTRILRHGSKPCDTFEQSGSIGRIP